MILQFSAGLRAGPGPGVPGTGGRVASCWGEGDAMRDLGEAKRDSYAVWVLSLHHGLEPSQSG